MSILTQKSTGASIAARLHSDDELNSAVNQLESRGYLEYRGFFPVALLTSINRKIDVSRAGKQGFEHFIADDVREIVSEIRAFAPFQKIEALVRDVTLTMHASIPALAGPREADRSFYVLRCVDPESDAVSHRRHYDSHLMTMLISLQTSPDEDENGDLVIYPNHRCIPRASLNLLQKVGTRLHQIMPLSFRKKITRTDLGSARAVRVHAVAGDLYVFNGLVSMHCNFNVRQGERRSLLIHDYDPKLAFGITGIFRSLRQKCSSLARAGNAARGQ